MIQNCKDQSLARRVLQRFPIPLSSQVVLVALVSVARVRPRTSKGITDLLLPQTSMCLNHIVPLRRILLEIGAPSLAG